MLGHGEGAVKTDVDRLIHIEAGVDHVVSTACVSGRIYRQPTR